MATKFDTRQSVNRSALPMVGSSANESLDQILAKVDPQLAKLFEDRNVLLQDGGLITFTGTALQFTEALKLSVNSRIAGGAPVVIDLGSVNRAFSASGRMLYAVINRTAGTAVVTADATTLPAVTSADQEVFLIAKRVDATDGTKRVYFRQGTALDEGDTVRLGAAGSGSGGAGLGDDINTLRFRASFSDAFADKKAVNVTAGFTDETLYSAGKKLFRLSYDATQTVTGTGTAMTLSGAPSFTIKAGDVLRVGTEVRRITGITSQTVFAIDSAFSSDPSAAACTVAQAVHTVDVLDFDSEGKGLPLNSVFAENIESYMISYRDSAALDDDVFDNGTPALVGFSVSTDNASWSEVGARADSLTSDLSVKTPATEDNEFYLRFFPNATSGSGAVNFLDYKVYLYEETTTSSGAAAYKALARTDGAGTEVNCSVSSDSGKTRITTTFVMGSNIAVFLDGKKLPEFVDLTLTPDGYYKKITGTVIELDSDYSGVGLQVQIETSSNTIDNSEVNSSAIAAVQDFAGAGFQSFIDESATATVPNTTILNRKRIPNLANDLRARMGIDRVMTQQVIELQDEFGPNGEKVFKALNDDRDLTRFVGNWLNLNDANGLRVGSQNDGDYVETTFYGTGLNLLTFPSNAGYDYRASVDGGAESGNIYLSQSTVLQSRNYSPNVVLPVFSGLALGLHTVKIRRASTNLIVLGFEILNESSQVKVQPGTAFLNGKKIVSSSQSLLSYNTGFESILRDGASVGSLSTRGARVLTYMKSDGSIAKSAVTTDSTQKNLTLADHSNEEMTRTYYWREFGANRAEDFSTITISSTDNRAFTLDDGTTSLVGVNVQQAEANFLNVNGLNEFITFTFVGTGLDIHIITDGTTRAFESVFVDGVNIGSISKTANTPPEVRKVVSGLPYGTHTVKFQRTIAAASLRIKQFIVYGPKKPAVPAGAVELADYNVMADFVANSTIGMETISSGVLRKTPGREFTYIEGTGGTTSWVFNALVNLTVTILGFNMQTDRLNAKFKYTFFGTGFDWRFRGETNSASNVSVTMNGIALTAANFPSATFSTYGTGSGFNSSTGVLDQATSSTQVGSGFRVSGLPLALYTVEANNNVAGEFLRLDAFDIITPIHSPKSNLVADLQNTLPVGSCAISDNRKLTPVKELTSTHKFRGMAVGVANSPSTTSSAYIPIPDMSLTVKAPKGGAWFDLSLWSSISGSSTGQDAYIAIYVDGSLIPGGATRHESSVASRLLYLAVNSMIFLSEGVHKVEGYWKIGGGSTMIADQTQRALLAKEL